ncbi:MAG: endolytic transglycosylase MltG [Bacteroidia bacterium]|nr:endolytic transglycosylase MltG [Bacteroidia bacterium]
MKKWLSRPVVWLAVLAAAALLIIPYYRKVFAPNTVTPDGKPAELLIYTGWDYTSVGDQLIKQKLLRDAKSFHWVAERMGYPGNVRPGRYLIPDGMSNRALLTLLRSGKQAPVRFTFVKFRTREQLANYVDEKLEMNAADLLEVMSDAGYLDRFNGLTPETAISVFIPNTYEVYWNVTPRDFYKRMYTEYQTFWNDERNRKREKLGLNRIEVMTLASIIEEETNQQDEKPVMAGVLLNRIRKGIKLEADPTVRFAVGDFTIRRVLQEHLQTDSPYNTYLYPGIPPGPICTPSIASVDAVLNPEKHGYYFYCARIDGTGYHHFSATFEEHLAYANQYRSSLNQRGIR